VDVAFEVVYGDKGKFAGVCEGFGVGDADKERAGETGAGGDGDGIEIGESDAGLGKGGADDGDNGAQMLAAGQLGDDSTIARVGGDLRGDGRGKRAGAALNDGRGGFIAGGFDAEDEATGHGFSLASWHAAARRVSEFASSRGWWSMQGLHKLAAAVSRFSRVLFLIGGARRREGL